MGLFVPFIIRICLKKIPLTSQQLPMPLLSVVH